MAWTQADITAVQDAIRALIAGRPVQDYTVTLPGGGTRQTKYMTIGELRALLDEMRSEMKASQVLVPHVPTRFGVDL